MAGMAMFNIKPTVSVVYIAKFISSKGQNPEKNEIARVVVL
jgi:hypothetical protein